MVLLYILLIIIAIGVLLITNEGKNILAVISKLAVAGVLIYLGFWIIVIGFEFFSKTEVKEFLGRIILIILAIYCTALVWRKRKEIPGRINTIIVKNWEKSKISTITWLVIITLILYFIITMTITQSWQKPIFNL